MSVIRLAVPHGFYAGNCLSLFGDFLLLAMNMNLATTTFADIQRLPPAHSLICVEGEVSVQSYFQLPEENEYLRYKQPEEYVEHFRALFEEAVADRLRTDKGVGGANGSVASESSFNWRWQTGHMG